MNNSFMVKILWRVRDTWFATKKAALASIDEKNKPMYALDWPTVEDIERVKVSVSTPEALAKFLNERGCP